MNPIDPLFLITSFKGNSTISKFQMYICFDLEVVLANDLKAKSCVSRSHLYNIYKSQVTRTTGMTNHYEAHGSGQPA